MAKLRVTRRGLDVDALPKIEQFKLPKPKRLGSFLGGFGIQRAKNKIGSTKQKGEIVDQAGFENWLSKQDRLSIKPVRRGLGVGFVKVEGHDGSSIHVPRDIIQKWGQTQTDFDFSPDEGGQ